MGFFYRFKRWCRDVRCDYAVRKAIRKLQKQQIRKLKGEILTWFVIGKISVEVWNALLPQEQAIRVAVMANAFVEQQSCHKVTIDVDEDDEYVTFSAACTEVKL
jgi:hypothetical protein